MIRIVIISIRLMIYIIRLIEYITMFNYSNDIIYHTNYKNI